MSAVFHGIAHKAGKARALWVDSVPRVRDTELVAANLIRGGSQTNNSAICTAFNAAPFKS